MGEAGSKILVVEDNPMNLELVSDILKSQGYQVLQAQEGQQALAMALAEKPDLILMDIQLPEMDGLEVTRRLKQNEETSDIVVVALTAHAMRGDEERFREAGCSGYIAKPIRIHEFIATVAGFLGAAEQEA